MLVVGGHDGAKHLRLGQLMLDPGGKPHQVTGIDRSSINMVCVLEAGIPWLVWGLQLECWIYDTHIYIYILYLCIYIIYYIINTYYYICIHSQCCYLPILLVVSAFSWLHFFPVLVDPLNTNRVLHLLAVRNDFYQFNFDSLECRSLAVESTKFLGPGSKFKGVPAQRRVGTFCNPKL
jgi:hypothetical protein